MSLHAACLAGLAGLAVLLAPRAAEAGDTARERLPVLDRYQLAAGVYASRNGLSGHWDSNEHVVGTAFSFQRDLGFDGRENLLFWSGGVGFGPERQYRVDLSGYAHSADSAFVLERDFLINGEVFPAQAQFTGSLDIRTRKASFSWFFHRSEASAFGAGIGVVEYHLRSRLVATLGETAVRARLDERVWAPMIRAEYRRALGERWRVGTGLSWIGKGSGGTTGHAVDAYVGVEYFPREHLGLSLRYGYNNVDVDLQRVRYDGNVDLDTRGPQLLVMFRY